jgi:RHS repeat-associated protein
VKLQGAYTVYGYDVYYRLTSVDHYEKVLGTPVQMIKLDWSYDALWRKDATTDPNNRDIKITSNHTGGKNKIDITYDKASRLTREKLTDGTLNAWDIIYTYDKGENRLTLNDAAKTYTHTNGAQNREASVSASPTATPTPVAMTYNFKGDVTARQALVPLSPSTNDTYAYTWDAYDQLLTATKNGGATVSYAYDAWGRLLKRTKSGVTEYYYYCGMTRITEYTGASMSKSYQFIPGAAVGGVLAMLQPGAATYFGYNDLGTVVAQTDTDARKSGLWVPDFFGNYENRYKATGSGTRPALGLTGKLYDADAGLYYFGARWYDPERGHWMSTEPIGLEGPNWYNFVSNDVANYADLWGYAKLYTMIEAGNTIWDPEDDSPIIIYKSLVKVVSNAKPGAGGPFCAADTYVADFEGNAQAFGPGPKIKFKGKCGEEDIRERWIHGGGSRLGKKNSALPMQPLVPTLGCTRMYNKDVKDLAERIRAYQHYHPGEKIPYIRQ